MSNDRISIAVPVELKPFFDELKSVLKQNGILKITPCLQEYLRQNFIDFALDYYGRCAPLQLSKQLDELKTQYAKNQSTIKKDKVDYFPDSVPKMEVPIEAMSTEPVSVYPSESEPDSGLTFGQAAKMMGDMLDDW